MIVMFACLNPYKPNTPEDIGPFASACVTTTSSIAGVAAQ